MKPTLTLRRCTGAGPAGSGAGLKWTDADGRFITTGLHPPRSTLADPGYPVLNPRRTARWITSVRCDGPLGIARTARGESGRPGARARLPHSSRRKKNTPTHIGYEDQAKIDNLNSDIRRLSSTRQRQQSCPGDPRGQERIAADLIASTASSRRKSKTGAMHADQPPRRQPWVRR